MSKMKEKVLIVFNETGSHTMDLISRNESEANRVKALAKLADNFIKQVWDNEDDAMCITIRPDTNHMEVLHLSSVADCFTVHLPYKYAYALLEQVFGNPDFVLQLRQMFPLWHLTACLKVAIYRLWEG